MVSRKNQNMDIINSYNVLDENEGEASFEVTSNISVVSAESAATDMISH